MSERASRWLIPACVGAVFAVVPMHASAQQMEEELLRTLHDAVARLPAAEEAAREVAERRRRMLLEVSLPAIDTIMVGPLRVLTPPDQRAMAERIFGDVWREYEPFLESSPALEETTFTFQWGASSGPIPVDGKHRDIAMLRWRSERAVRHNVRTAIATTLFEDLPESVREWAGTPVREPADARLVHMTLATAPSKAARNCLVGDVAGCWSALQLELDETPYDEWYTPEERRALIARSSWWGREDAPRREACVERGSIPDCDALLLASTWHRAPLGRREPLGALLWIALRSGGPGAWERIREDPSAGPADALRHASGMSTEELVAEWRAWKAQEVAVERGTFGLPIPFYLMWIAVFAAFAMRSTRCRLG